jgi:putative ABC transport system substrate-binding protein
MSCWSFGDMRRREFIKIVASSAGAVWPLTASAQQPAMPVIGFMSGRSPEDSAQNVSAFRQGLTGFVEGQTVAIEFRWAKGDYDRLPVLASDLINPGLAVLVAIGGDASPLAAKKLAVTIPVVFGMGGDPIKAGLYPLSITSVSTRLPGG